MFTTTHSDAIRSGLLALATVTVLLPASAAAQGLGSSGQGQVAAHAGIGFDVTSGGAALNLGLAYRHPVGAGANWIEGAADAFHHSSSEDWVEGNYSGVEQTELNIFAVRVNYLLNYERGGVYPIVGFGLFAAGVEWSETEQFQNDPTNVSYDDFEGTAFGNIFNLGFGLTAGKRVDLRFEAPIMIFWGVEQSTISIPITASVGVRL